MKQYTFTIFTVLLSQQIQIEDSNISSAAFEATTSLDSKECINYTDGQKVKIPDKDILFFKDSESSIDYKGINYTIERDVIISKNNAEDNPTGVFEVSYFIRDYLNISDPPDVYLNFVYYDNEIYVYWRQTYLHRQYLFGLISLNGTEYSAHCIGKAGYSQRH